MVCIPLGTRSLAKNTSGEVFFTLMPNSRTLRLRRFTRIDVLTSTLALNFTTNANPRRGNATVESGGCYGQVQRANHAGESNVPQYSHQSRLAKARHIFHASHRLLLIQGWDVLVRHHEEDRRYHAQNQRSHRRCSLN